MRPERSPRDADSRAVPVVVIACPGAGIVGRGYESFAIELAEHLQGCPELKAVLATGGPLAGDWVRRVPTLGRFSLPARLVARAFRVPPTLVEQVTFGLASLPVLWRLRPETVLMSERGLGGLYCRVRRSRLGRLFRFDPSLILSNGGGSPSPYPHFDLVQHVTPVTYEAALVAGEPPRKHVCLPYGFRVPSRSASTRRPRAEDGRRPVVISVGSLDISRKRMDHVIREVANMTTRPYLILLGQQSDETSALEALAQSLLGSGNYELSSVRPDQVGDFYAKADVFTLASVDEAFGRVYIEAMMHGLPCVVHDFPVARYVLGATGVFVDMTVDGQLARALEELLEREDGDGGDRRREAAVARFAWKALIPQYVALLTKSPPA